jgi:hypothetical protein
MIVDPSNRDCTCSRNVRKPLCEENYETGTQTLSVRLRFLTIRDAIIQRQRCSSPAELQYVIDHAKEFRLTDGERQQISVDVTIAMAQRARRMNERRDDPGARFIAQTLGLLPTPFGLVARSFIDDLLRDGARNIARCKRHQLPRCECWSAQRAILWQAQSDHGTRSPESWAANRIYEVLEDLELSSRPERGPGVV